MTEAPSEITEELGPQTQFNRLHVSYPFWYMYT